MIRFESDYEGRIITLEGELALCKKAIANGGNNVVVTNPKIEVPKPQSFTGNRDVKEVEHFLFQMETYFEGINLTEGASKVKTASYFFQILHCCGGNRS